MDTEEKLVSLTFGDQISITTTDNEGFLALGQNDVPCVKLERYLVFKIFFFIHQLKNIIIIITLHYYYY